MRRALLVSCSVVMCRKSALGTTKRSRNWPRNLRSWPWLARGSSMYASARESAFSPGSNASNEENNGALSRSCASRAWSSSSILWRSLVNASRSLSRNITRNTTSRSARTQFRTGATERVPEPPRANHRLGAAEAEQTLRGLQSVLDRSRRDHPARIARASPTALSPRPQPPMPNPAASTPQRPVSAPKSGQRGDILAGTFPLCNV